MPDAATALAIFVLLLLAGALAVVLIVGDIIGFKRIKQRVLEKGSWVKIVNTSCEPLLYGQVVGTKFLGTPNFAMALWGLLLPEAFSAELVTGLNERFPGQKDAEGHFLVLALTGGDLDRDRAVGPRQDHGIEPAICVDERGVHPSNSDEGFA